MPSISELIQEKSARDEAWRAERQAERENLSEIRNSALEEITTNPEAYLKYLKLQADIFAATLMYSSSLGTLSATQPLKTLMPTTPFGRKAKQLLTAR